jgi:hypothetical protein
MAEVAEAKAPDPARPLCWICNRNEANSGEHKTKRSHLLAVLGEPTQEEPFYFHDLKRRNRPVGSLNAKILKAPIRICAECNTTRTQPHDRAWEEMSDGLHTVAATPRPCHPMLTMSKTSTQEWRCVRKICARDTQCTAAFRRAVNT